MPPSYSERQLTSQPHGHILTNAGVWSADGQWIVYDVRSDPAGSHFDGTRIERINVETKEVQVLHQATNGACVGVVTCSPSDDRIVFIQGPERPTPDWSYNAYHRQGVVLHADCPSTVANLDARHLTPPFTPGALRGGSHVHTFDARGEWVAFTYEDHVLAQVGLNRRTIGISAPVGPVRVQGDHPRNHDGSHFSVVAARTSTEPRPGSDEIARAFEDSWVGVNGYLRADGTGQRRAIAFQGAVMTAAGQTISEVFIVDLPDDVTVPGDGPLEGTEWTMPHPPKETVQRRLTFTADRPCPGLQGPRHWPRSSPDGSRIAFLMKDVDGIVQLWTVSPNGGMPRQLSCHPGSIASAFTWSPDGRWIAHVMDNSVFLTDTTTGEAHRLTARSDDAWAPRPEACVFSPDGRQIAYVRPVAAAGGVFNQIFSINTPA